MAVLDVQGDHDKCRRGCPEVPWSPASVISKLWSAGIPVAHEAAVIGYQCGVRGIVYPVWGEKLLRPILAAIEAIDYGNITVAPW